MECWNAAGLWDNMRAAVWSAEGFKEAPFHFLTTMDKDTVREFINTLWCIWRRRNDRVWHGVEVSAREAVTRSKEYMQDWFNLRSKAEAHNMQLSGAINPIWIKPTPENFKCNLDVAIFSVENKFGVSMCIRGDQGQFIKAKTSWFHGSPSPQEAEAIGLIEGLSWVQSLGSTKMYFELDCKSIVEDIIEGKSYNTEYGSILKNCTGLLKLNKNYEVSFIRR